MKEKAGRVWYFFRSGYSTYLAFAFGFSNFLLLLYGLTPLKDKIGLVEFGIISGSVLIPIAVIIGILHNRTQIPVEQKIAAHINPYKDKILPNSKETFSNDYNVFGLNNSIWNSDVNIWNMNHAKWNLEHFIFSTNYTIFNIELTKKNMLLTNRLLKHLIPDLPEDMLYNSEFYKLDEYKSKLMSYILEAKDWSTQTGKKIQEQTAWLNGLETWRDAFVLLGRGHSVQDAIQQTMKRENNV